jgi:hypothetical protein
VAAAAVGLAVLGVWAFHPFGCWPVFGLTVAGAVFLPVAPDLAGRVLRLGAWFFGFGLAAWLIPFPAGLSRAGLLAALVAGGLAWAALRRTRPLRPEIPLEQGLVLIPLAVAGLVAYRGFFLARTGYDVVRILAQSWDRASHYYMAALTRSEGALIWSLPAAADGTGYGFTEYPPAYAAAAATLMDLVRPVTGAPGLGGFATYLHVFGLISVALGLMAAAGVLVATGDRSRHPAPVFAALAAGMAVVLGPVAAGVPFGHDNFAFAVVLAFAAWAGAFRLRHLWRPGEVALVVAGVAGAACTWTPLGVVAALFAVVALVRGTALSPRGHGAATVAGTAAVVALGAVPTLVIGSRLLRRVPAGDLLTAVGGVGKPTAATTILAFLTLLAAYLALRRLPRVPEADRARAGALALTLGVVGVVWFGAAVAQYVAEETVLYYLAKLGAGLTMLTLPVALATGALWCAHAPAERPPGRLVLSLAALVGLVFFGPPVTPAVLGLDRAYPAEAVEIDEATDPDYLPAMERALATPEGEIAVVAFTPWAVPVSGDTMSAASLRLAYTQGTATLLNEVMAAASGTWPELVDVLRPYLADGRATLIVPPWALAEVQAAAGTLADRVTTWG